MSEEENSIGIFKELEQKINQLENVTIREHNLQTKYELMYFRDRIDDLEECVKEECEKMQEFREKIIELKTKVDVVLAKDDKTHYPVLDFLSKNKFYVALISLGLTIPCVTALFLSGILEIQHIKDLIKFFFGSEG